VILMMVEHGDGVMGHHGDGAMVHHGDVGDGGGASWSWQQCGASW
jgi:hypothetical protein